MTNHKTSASLLSHTYENLIPLEQHQPSSLPLLSTPSMGISKQKYREMVGERDVEDEDKDKDMEKGLVGAAQSRQGEA